jgi:murein DD-endopeptidase MepM/ murein hydrolase activator NlpD
VNLRAAASTDSAVLGVLPAGVELWITGQIVNGFAEVSGDAGAGWVSTQYLTSEAPVAPTAPAAPAPSGSGLVVWPVSGGEWSFLQGYNGSSHYDSGLWQYGDSIDLVRTDGSTAGQPIYSPVSGTIRWFDPSTGGISIDMGNGYAFAMFHAYYDGSLQEGDFISQGQYIGTIAPAYEAAAGSNPHLHIAVWATSDGGNWSRESVPFTGALALSGNEFYNTGVSFEHTGTVFYP